jgi:Putative peptidoglycan binding domain
MLPTVMTARNTIAAALAALSIAAVPAAPAFAWGDREQGFVAGVATALIVDELLKQNRRSREVRRVPGFSFADPRPTYIDPRPTVSTSVYRTSAARAFNSYSVTERKEIQRNLRALGYYRGGIDGTFGPGTYSAVTTYARDEGLAGNLATNAGAFAIYDGLIF